MQKWYASDLLINHPYKCILHMFIGSACRHKVVGCLKKQYKAPKDAECAYSDGRSTVRNPTVDPSSDEQSSADIVTTVEPSAIQRTFQQLSPAVQVDLLSKLFSSYASRELGLSVPNDFIALAAKAMVHLKENNRSNVLYKLAMVIGTMREDGSDSRLPVRRMPMGLVEYIANFFAADNLQLVSKEYVY